jgi:DNA-binding MarR family transcriptional regulator
MMVKKIDDSEPLVIDHIGVALWRAAMAWKKRLHSEMVERGHAWYGDARAVIAIHLEPRGMSQSELVACAGLTKQAVQQLLDSLEAEGIVRREANPDDRRSKRVVYTDKGLAGVRDAVTIKRAIEADYKRRLGARAFETMREALVTLAEDDAIAHDG